MVTSATKIGKPAMPLIPSLAKEHKGVLEGAGVAEPAPPDSDPAFIISVQN